MEWQADYLASALLMPEEPFMKAVENYMGFLKVGDYFETTAIDPFKDVCAEGLAVYLANIFKVSLTSAKIRLKNLGKIKDDRQCSII